MVRVDIVPASGPVLLCINHPNNLIDSLLVSGVLPRKVHYLATAALFRNPLVARFLAACGAIPVYRRQDDPDKMDRNADAFAACFRALERGQLVGIYPEGTTHSESRVQRIKTGAARIALDYQAAGRGAPLTLIPVGITFEARKAFRGQVRVSFGEPIPLAPYAPVYRDEPAKAVEALTTTIQWGMEAEILNVGRPERQGDPRRGRDLPERPGPRAAGGARPRGAPDRPPAALARDRGRGGDFQERDPERVARLWTAVQKYRALLAAYQVRDQAVRSRAHRPAPRARLRHSWEASIGFPFFAYGLVVNGLPYSCRAGSRAAPRARRRTTPRRGSSPASWHSRSSGRSRSGSCGGSGPRVGARVRGLAAGERPSRLSLSRGGRSATEPASLQRALPHPPPVRHAAPGGAAGPGGQAGAGQGRLPGRDAAEQL